MFAARDGYGTARRHVRHQLERTARRPVRERGRKIGVVRGACAAYYSRGGLFDDLRFTVVVKHDGVVGVIAYEILRRISVAHIVLPAGGERTRAADAQRHTELCVFAERTGDVEHMTVLKICSIPVKVVGNAAAQIAVNDNVARNKHFVIRVYARGVFRTARVVIFNAAAGDINIMTVDAARVIRSIVVGDDAAVDSHARIGADAAAPAVDAVVNDRAAVYDEAFAFGIA